MAQSLEIPTNPLCDWTDTALNTGFRARLVPKSIWSLAHTLEERYLVLFTWHFKCWYSCLPSWPNSRNSRELEVVAGRSDRAESQAQRHLDPIPGEPWSTRAGPANCPMAFWLGRWSSLRPQWPLRPPGGGGPGPRLPDPAPLPGPPKAHPGSAPWQVG